MSNVTITRADGSQEQIVLAESKEAGYDYFPFVCSDGATRYALLGAQDDKDASHLWIERNGTRQYALKSPVLSRNISVTKNDTIQHYWLAKSTDVNAAPPASGSADWHGDGTMVWDVKTDKVLFVSLQVANGYDKSSYTVSGLDGLTYLSGAESGYPIFKAVNPNITGDVALTVSANKQTIPSGVFGKTLNAKSMNATDTFTATVPDKISVLKATLTMGNGATQTKYIGVTAGKSYRIDITNYADSGSAGSVSWFAWTSLIGHYIDDKSTNAYYQDGGGGSGALPSDASKFVYSATFEYSAEINGHAVDIQDY